MKKGVFEDRGILDISFNVLTESNSLQVGAVDYKFMEEDIRCTFPFLSDLIKETNKLADDTLVVLYHELLYHSLDCSVMSCASYCQDDSMELERKLKTSDISMIQHVNDDSMNSENYKNLLD